MIRFAEPDPRVGAHPTHLGWWCISFVCPSCDPPFRIVINALEGGPPDQTKALWAVNFATRSVLESLTVTPSIDNSPGGHGKSRKCSWHGHITNGWVL